MLSNQWNLKSEVEGFVISKSANFVRMYLEDSTIVHRVAAIMFCDISGYSKLMSEDEMQAIQLRKQTEVIIKRQVAKHQGEIIQFYGDGSVTMFDDSREALVCALEIQREVSELPGIGLRIGIHRGDVAIEGENVYGVTVNIASRIESFCIPGAVLFSAEVHEMVLDAPGITSESMGEFQLKNIPGSIELFALKDDHLKIPSQQELHGKGEKAQRSVAVLPFVNMSPDPDNEFFSDGVSEEILNQLSKDEFLRVTARTSSFAFKGQNLDIREIGRQLNADVVLEGSVRKIGNRVRITAQLIKTEDGYHLFSKSFDRTLDDIFALQDEIAALITQSLKQSLGHRTRKVKKRSQPTSNLDAYNDFLRGLFYWNKYEPVEVKRALHFLESAIDKDPQFADPYSWISFCLSFLGGTEVIPGEEAFERARQAANRALALDPESVEAHCALGLVYMFQDWDLIKSESCFIRAKAINRQSDIFLQTYSLFLKAAGRFVEAVEIVEEAVVIDPVSVIANCYLADAYMNNQQFDEAIEQINYTLDLFPNNTMAILQKIWILVHRGEYEEAIALAPEKVPADNPFFSEFVCLRGHLAIKLGDTDRARKCQKRLEDLKEKNTHQGMMHQMVLLAYGLSETEKVRQLIREHLDQYRAGMIFGLHHPYWQKIWADPQLQDLRREFEDQVTM